jgi:hypothetical protein
MSSKNPTVELAKLRERIAALKQQQADLERHPLPQSIAYERIDRFIAELREDRYRALPGGGDFAWPEYRTPTMANGMVGSIDSMFAALLGDTLRDALRAKVDAFYRQVPEGLSDADRAARAEELASTLFDAECAEEQLIVAAEESGLRLQRRGDADPRAMIA